MPRIVRLLPALYLLLSATHLYAEWQFSEFLVIATKPLLLLTLAAWAFIRLRPLRERFSKLLVTALLCSLAGDSFLMLVSYGPRIEHFFLVGLGSFLVAQVCYAMAFASFPEASKGHLVGAPWKSWPFVLYLFGIVAILWPGLKSDLQLPVALYAISITAMALSAMNLRNALSRETYLGLMAGVLFFLLSDSLIGLSKFRPDALTLPNVRVWIMATYLGGQFLISANILEAFTQRSATSD